MPKKKSSDNTELVLKAVIEGIQEKKGKRIAILDLTKIPNCFSDYFVICEGENRNQTDAIADSAEEFALKVANQKPNHVEGKENANWILLDFATVLVHVFQKESRDFYNLEKLWADADIKILQDFD